MNYLITGAGGQLGREWSAFLEKSQASYVSFNSKELDITDAGRVTELVAKHQPGTVINCAAYTKVDQAESEPEKAFRVNETGVKNLVDACTSAGCKLVHYSTDYVFQGAKSDEKIYPDGYSEDAPVDPVNLYGRSKLAGEKIIEKSGIDSILLRVSWLCAHEGANFVNTMLRLGSEKDRLGVVNDQFGSPAYTFDVVVKTNQLLKNGMNGIFHITSKGKISWADFAEEIFRQSNMPVKVDRIPSSQFQVKAKRPAFSLLSTKKAEQAGLQILDWKEGLKQLLRKRNELL